MPEILSEKAKNFATAMNRYAGTLPEEERVGFYKALGNYFSDLEWHIKKSSQFCDKEVINGVDYLKFTFTLSESNERRRQEEELHRDTDSPL